MTPILIFFSWAWAEPAMPSATAATTSPPSRRAALRTSIKTSLENCALRFLFLLTPITWGAPTDVKRLATPARRQGVAGHANCLSVPNRASGNVAMRACARARRASTSRRGLDCARGSKNHDARGDFASTRNGASLRGVELPELRILIEPSCSDAAIGASEGERTGYSGLRLVKRRRTLSRGGTSPSGICVVAQAGGARTNALTGQPCLTLLWFLGCSGSSERSRNSDR